MLHMFPYAQQRGLITFLTTVRQGRRNLLPFLACCQARLCSTGGLITFLTTVRQGPHFFLPLLTCCTCSLMLNRGVDNFFDAGKTGSTKLVAVVDMLHVLGYAQQGDS